MKSTTFSVKARWRSILYACQGVIDFLRLEHNARIHLAATVCVTLLCCFTPLRTAELVLIVLATALVWITEIINTAIERMADIVSSRQQESIRLVKDMAAAAVLVAAIAAVVIAAVIFIPKYFV